jgi:ribosomal protein S18 acetylase RimI-like enzyme
VTPVEAEAFRALRLEALHDHPADFGSDWESEREQPLAHFAAQLADNHVMGAFVGGELAGLVCLLFYPKLKERHRAYIWGVYVGPRGRGRGVAGPLLDAALAVAFERVSQVELNVRVGNTAAERLYLSRGFVACGGIPGIHLVDGVLYDDTLMVLRREGVG